MSAIQKTPEQIAADVIESHDVGSVCDLAGLSEVTTGTREAATRGGPLCESSSGSGSRHAVVKVPRP